MPPPKIILSLSCMCLAGVFGIIAWHRLPRSFRLLPIVCLLGFTVTIGALYIFPNHWLFNLYIIAEFLLIVLAATSRTSSFFTKRIVPSFLLLYILAWSVYVISCGIHELAYPVFLLGCLLISITYINVLFRLYISGERVEKKRITLLCFALLLYFACSIPLFAMLKFLIHSSSDRAQKLYNTINWALSLVRYALLAIFFLLYALKKNESSGKY
jgi:uncharacterized membrane protein